MQNGISLLPEAFRASIETGFYAKTNAQAALENLLTDPDFHNEPVGHVGFYADHGVVHVRDVIRQTITVLEAVNGVLIPRRDRPRLEFFMKGYGQLLAMLHDIGMVNFSAFGRTMHPEFAAQWVFTPDFDPLLELVWDENTGNIPWRLDRLARNGQLQQEPMLVLREMLALSCCHSKSKVPIQAVNIPGALRRLMQHIIGTDLHTLYHEYTTPSGMTVLNGVQLPTADNLRRLYVDFEREAFAWLENESEEGAALVADVQDTLRALRCADALRQRGTVMKTSGNYEMFVDQMTAHALVAMRRGDQELFLVTITEPLPSGETNIASSELRPDGNLYISFHRGRFATDEVTLRAAAFAAVAINDIQADVIGSFERRGNLAGLKTTRDIRIVLEGVDDNLDFAEAVRAELVRLNPSLREQAQTMPAMGQASEHERKRYEEAEPLGWDLEQKEAALQRIASSGHNIETIDLTEGFRDVRLAMLEAGETLIEAKAPSSFVYIPLSEGLEIMPLGGYEAFSVQAWMPLGSTGVIRGAVRNATVVSTAPLSLLIIPKETYLRQWHRPYNIVELMERLGA